MWNSTGTLSYYTVGSTMYWRDDNVFAYKPNWLNGGEIRFYYSSYPDEWIPQDNISASYLLKQDNPDPLLDNEVLRLLRNGI